MTQYIEFLNPDTSNVDVLIPRVYGVLQSEAFEFRQVIIPVSSGKDRGYEVSDAKDEPLIITLAHVPWNNYTLPPDVNTFTGMGNIKSFIISTINGSMRPFDIRYDLGSTQVTRKVIYVKGGNTLEEEKYKKSDAEIFFKMKLEFKTYIT